jgi:hypothetical protein
LQIDPSSATYLAGVPGNPRFAGTVGSVPFEFLQVEIAPLISFQGHVELDKVESMSAAVQAAAADGARTELLLQMCLPHGLSNIQFVQSTQPGSYLAETEDLNLRVLTQGQFGRDVAGHLLAGVAFGESSPLVQVVEFGGKHFLKNGYHRAVGLGMSGESHMPAIVLHAADFETVGANFFERSLLEGPNPPTCSHFLDGTAVEQSLRKARRLISVTWSDHVLLEQ